MRVFSAIPLLSLALLSTGCTSGTMKADSAVTLPSGSCAVLTTSGKGTTVELTRAADPKGPANTSVVLLQGPTTSLDATGSWKYQSTSPLPVGMLVLHEPTTPENRVVIVNHGDTVVDVRIRVTDADGIELIQAPPPKK